MKLLIAADIFPPAAGGPATYSVTLANELVKLGDSVTIVSLNPQSDKKVLDERVQLFSVAFKNKLLRYAHYFWLLWKQAKNVDVMYAMGPVNAGWPASLVARLRKKKLAVKVVGDYAWEQGQVLGLITDSIDDFQAKKYLGKVRGLKDKECMVVQGADLVITPCEYLKKMVIGWGAPTNRVQVVYNAVKFADVAPVPKPTGERWVVTVARLTPWKGVRALIEAVSSLKEEIPEIKFKVVGDGPEMLSLQSFVAEKKFGDMVEFLGKLSPLETKGYIKAADVFALNSGYEGLPHVILEAYFLGVPVVASRMGGNQEVVSQETLFEYNNVADISQKIRKVLATGMGSVFSFEKFKMERMIAGTRKLLQSLCVN